MPRFYTAAPEENGSLAQKLREEARSKFLQNKSKQLLDNNELHHVWTLLEQHHSSPTVEGEKWISTFFNGAIHAMVKKSKG